MLPIVYDVASHRLLGSSTGFQLSMRSCIDASPLVNRMCSTNAPNKLRIFSDAAVQVFTRYRFGGPLPQSMSLRSCGHACVSNILPACNRT
jgi:hypothetical protein